MTRPEHPFTSEELMAYVDGELDSTQIAQLEEHMEACKDCSTIVNDARNVSLEMSAWHVGDAPKRLAEAVLGDGRQPQRSGWVGIRRWVYGFAGAFAVFLIVATLAIPSLLRSRQAANSMTPTIVAGPTAVQKAVPSVQRGQADSMTLYVVPGQTAVQKVVPFGPQGQQAQDAERAAEQRVVPNAEAKRQQAVQRPAPATTFAPAGPMVIRSLRLTIVTKEFDAARTRIDDIIRQSQGYAESLNVQGDPGSGRSLSAILRVPSAQVDSVLPELRKLGRVMDESQNSTDVASQYADLVARLNVARNTEQRLLTLLRERTGNLKDVVDVEREISSVRERIEQMEAQQKGVNNKVDFASIQLQLSEEYHAQLQPSTPDTKTQLRNAFVDGIRSAKQDSLDIALFLLRSGPELVIWFIVLGTIVAVIWSLRLKFRA